MSTGSTERWKYVLGTLTAISLTAITIYTIIKQKKNNNPSKPKQDINEKDTSSLKLENDNNKKIDSKTENKQNSDRTSSSNDNANNIIISEKHEKQKIIEDKNEQKQNQDPINWTTKGFKYKSNFDKNGIIYNLGTEYGTKKDWINPATTNKVKLSSSGIKNDSSPLSSIIGREAVRCVLAHKENSWFVVDFGDKFKICPKYYTLRHYISWDVEALRCWNFEGSINGNDWILIKCHEQDSSLNLAGKSVSWSLNTLNYFNQFRVLMTDKNDSNHDYLCCSGFEIYGIVNARY